MDLITMVLACNLYSNSSITNAMAQVGSKNNALMVTVAGSPPKNFTTQKQALVFANDQLKQGHDIEIGLMQVHSRWFHKYHLTTADLLAPCKNMVAATHILNHAIDECTDIQANYPSTDVQACALSIYKSGDPSAGLDYASNITTYSAAHHFEDILAAEKKKNPKRFNMPEGALTHPTKPVVNKPKKLADATPDTSDQATADQPSVSNNSASDNAQGSDQALIQAANQAVGSAPPQ